MAKKKKQKSEFDGLLDGSAIDSLQKMVDDMLKLATTIKSEYKADELAGELADLSGSVYQISENSPFLNELFQGDAWKKVMSMGSVLNETTGSKTNDTE